MQHDLVAPAPTSDARWRASAVNRHSRYRTPQLLHRMHDPNGCYGMISFSLPFREGGGKRFKLGRLGVETPPRGVQVPNRRVLLDPVGDAVPLEGDESVIRLGECNGLLGREGRDNSLDGDVCGPEWDWDSP